MDLSCKINNEYILYKKIEETRNEMNDKFDSLINAIKSCMPFINIEINKKNGFKKQK